jgi:protein SCO1/2
MKPWFPAIVLALMGLVAGLALSLYLSSEQHRDQPRPTALLWPNPKTLSAFQLIDQHGKPFDAARLNGHWSFLFFGYTNCPDVCPSTLEFFKQLGARLATNRDLLAQPQFILISVDPERDDPQRLREYLDYFDSKFIGLTGTPGQINSVTSQLGVLAVKVESESDDGSYLIDHSASIFLVDPYGRLVGVFGLPHELEVIANEFEAIVRFIEEQA